MTYDDDNRISTFNGLSVSYDLDGNLTSGPGTNNAFVSYAYNARNQLTNAAGLAYTYDPAGNRIAITNGATVTRFVLNPNSRLAQVLMRITGGVTNFYIYGQGLLYEITETAGSTNTSTYHFDYRGSTVAITDQNGNPTDLIEYSAYGLMTYRAGTTDTPFLYNGRYGVMTDPNGLLFMQARYYNPYICRFINADPSGFSGGLNWYAYASGNPISQLDPFGLGASEVSGVSSWIDRGANAVFGGRTGDAIDSTMDTIGDWTTSAGGAVAHGLGQVLGTVYQALDRLDRQGGGGGNEPQAAMALTLLSLLATDGESLLARTAAEGGAADSAMLGGRFPNPRSMRNVNPLRDTLNCGECAVYGDDILAGGNATVAGRSGLTDLSAFERIYGQSWSGPFSGSSALTESIGSLPAGSRGLVFGMNEGADVGHYFNFVNTKAGPVFLDFQKGTAISPGNFSGFRLLQTR
jgi:RHS repeat-associated protein